jgi:hypothetical protein
MQALLPSTASGWTSGSLELQFKDRSVIAGKQYWIEVDYSWGDWYKSVNWHYLKVSPSPSTQSTGPWIKFLNLDEARQKPISPD